MIILSDTDFAGKWDLTKSNNDLIAEYILEYEEKYLTELLGKELYDLFIADLNAGVPQDPIYVKIFNPFTEKINQITVASDGIKKMLLGLIYFMYVRDNRTKQTMNGAVEQQTEVSVKSDNTFLYLRYNDAVRTYQAIQKYIYHNKSVTYPAFDGVVKNKVSFI